MTDLSVLIPARNERFLARTIQDILTNLRGDTEVIAVLDGEWAEPPVEDHERVTLLYYPQSIGQRAATNRAASIATGRYVMKVDAHCTFDEGFDVKLMADMQDDWTVVPIMRNLHAFNWVCPNGHARYQGPSGPCNECGEPTTMDVVWIAKPNPSSTSYCFDPTLHFQYFNNFKKRPEGRGDLTETMSLQGSCFMMTRERYFDLDICDESWGNWGNQGTEVACKSWLSGGRVICNHKTFYAHMFRTQGADFGFPYPLGGREVERARQRSRDLFLNNAWDRQVKPLSWLVEKFWPVDHWTEGDLAKLKETDGKFAVNVIKSERVLPKGIVYYTDGRLDPVIMTACQNQLIQAVDGMPIAVVSIAPVSFGSNGRDPNWKSIQLPYERGYLSMFKQILAGLELLDTEYAYLAEHDVLYHPSHFTFTPPENDVYYYNTNVWRVRYEDGHALYYFQRSQSGLCGNRQFLIDHYRKRVEKTERKFIELGGDTHEYRRFIREMGFEPGTHHRSERVDDFKAGDYRSEYPNIDIRHNQNLTPNRWRQDQFRSQRNCRDWTEAEEVPGWGKWEEIWKLSNIYVPA